MKTIINIFFIVTCFILMSCSKNKEDQLIGAWQISELLEDGVRLEGVETYNANNTGTSVGSLSNGAETITFVTSQTWALDGNTLTYTITSSNLPNLIPVGYTDSSTIVSLNSNILVTKSADGTTTTSIRK